MSETKELYSSFVNPFLIESNRSMPDEMAVIGAGNIGPDIAYYMRTGAPDKKLYLVDVVEEPLKKAEERFNGYAQKALKRKILSQEEVEKILGNIVYTTDYSQIINCKLVIEAATEDLNIKKKIFAQLEEIVSEDAVLTSNTSSIPADQIFSEMKHSERSTVTHFFAPAWRSMAVEVVRWDALDPEVLNFLIWFFANTGKAPVVTKNVFSFLLNRIFENWTNEAAVLLNNATTFEIDDVAEEFVGAGPFFVLEMAGGNPLTYESQTRRMEENECYKPPSILKSVKSWNLKKRGEKVEMPDAHRMWIRDRLIGLVFSQCFDIADRNIGTRSDLNFGSLIALGFKKGVFDTMADIGADEVKRIADAFVAERPGYPAPTKPIAEYLDFARDILVDDKDGVRIITIRRPQAANALGWGTAAEILAELKKGEDDPTVKGFILTGYGQKAFCAGADIGGFVDAFDNKEAGIGLAKGNSEMLHYMDQMSKPLVAAVNGLAMGGGVETMFRCHSIVANKKAFFRLPEITLGILPGMGGCVIPYRKWPQASDKFHEMIGKGKIMKAAEAREFGIINQLVDSYSEMIDVAMEEVERLQGNIPRISDAPVDIPEFIVPDQPSAINGDPLSKEVLTVIADVINRGAKTEGLYSALEINYDRSGDTHCLEDSKEGVMAFLEKRKPNFKN